MRCFFFFQAEDGIRDLTVTGVQTCALPIFLSPATRGLGWFALSGRGENGDKGNFVEDTSFVTFSNGSNWHIQAEWSNAANQAGTRHLNPNSEPACLYHPRAAPPARAAHHRAQGAPPGDP